MKIITRRQMLKKSGALMGAIALPKMAIASGRTYEPYEEELYSLAKEEGSLTWYTGQMATEPSEELGKAFMSRYPGIKINVFRSSAQVNFQRLAQDIRARIAQCDVFSTTALSHMTLLMEQEQLMPYKSHGLKNMIKEVAADNEPDGYYQITNLMPTTIIVRNSIPEEERPRAWTDLLDEQWKDKIAVGHPGYSGVVGLWAVMMDKLYGTDYFINLEKNNPQIGRSASEPADVLNAGERSVGASVPSSTTYLSMSRGNPIDIIYPEDGTLLVTSPSGIIANAPSPNAAKLFMEFMAGPEFSETSRRYYSDPLHDSVEPVEGAKRLSDVKIMTLSPDEINDNIERIKTEWRDVFRI